MQILIKINLLFYSTILLCGCEFLNPFHRGFLDWNQNYIYEEDKEQTIKLCGEMYKKNEDLYQKCLQQNGLISN